MPVIYTINCVNEPNHSGSATKIAYYLKIFIIFETLELFQVYLINEQIFIYCLMVFKVIINFVFEKINCH